MAIVVSINIGGCNKNIGFCTFIMHTVGVIMKTFSQRHNNCPKMPYFPQGDHKSMHCRSYCYYYLLRMFFNKLILKWGYTETAPHTSHNLMKSLLWLDSSMLLAAKNEFNLSCLPLVWIILPSNSLWSLAGSIWNSVISIHFSSVY